MKIGFITGNMGKYSEAKESLGDIAEIVMLPLSPPEIQEDDLRSVAEFSLRYLMMSGKIGIDDGIWIDGERFDLVFLEDAGLFIDALNGFPGVYSAYVFKTIGYTGILKIMDGIENRRAHFAAVIAAVNPDGEIIFFSGRCDGTITMEPRGTGGFGYDPIFRPNGHDRTFAEMTLGEKDALSHRGQAMAKLRQYLTSNVTSRLHDTQ